MKALHSLVGQLPYVEMQTGVLKPNACEFLDSDASKADILIHLLGCEAEVELEAIARQDRHSRPITLIVHDQVTADPHLMRLAMQAGARDFITGPQVIDDTLTAVRKILKDDIWGNGVSPKALTAVLNAKGGAGGSTIACALAYALATREGMQTLLIDLDLQFGTQCLLLNLDSTRSIVDALAAIESLDEIALMGYVAKHGSGLHVLNRPEQEIVLPGEIDEQRLGTLIALARKSYDHLVVDLPRLIDPIFNLVLEQADHVILVMQQELFSLREAQRMIQIMSKDLGVPLERIVPVLNRYKKNDSFSLDEVERVLALKSVMVVPNDFKNLSMASNLGVPIAEHAPGSPATLSIQKLAEILGGKKHLEKLGILKQLLLKLFSED